MDHRACAPTVSYDEESAEISALFQLDLPTPASAASAGELSLEIFLPALAGLDTQPLRHGVEIAAGGPDQLP